MTRYSFINESNKTNKPNRIIETMANTSDYFNLEGDLSIKGNFNLQGEVSGTSGKFGALIADTIDAAKITNTKSNIFDIMSKDNKAGININGDSSSIKLTGSLIGDTGSFTGNLTAGMIMSGSILSNSDLSLFSSGNKGIFIEKETGTVTTSDINTANVKVGSADKNSNMNIYGGLTVTGSSATGPLTITGTGIISDAEPEQTEPPVALSVTGGLTTTRGIRSTGIAIYNLSAPVGTIAPVVLSKSGILINGPASAPAGTPTPVLLTVNNGATKLGPTTTGALTSSGLTVSGTSTLGATTLGATTTGALTSSGLTVSGTSTLGATTTGALTSSGFTLNGTGTTNNNFVVKKSGTDVFKIDNATGNTLIGSIAAGNISANNYSVSGNTVFSINSTGNITTPNLTVSGPSTLGVTTTGALTSSALTVSGGATLSGGVTMTNPLNIKSTSGVVLTANTNTTDQNKIQVYRNANGTAPYLYYNKDGALGVWNGTSGPWAIYENGNISTAGTISATGNISTTGNSILIGDGTKDSSLTIGKWKIESKTTDPNLRFYYDGTQRVAVSTAGAIIAGGDISTSTNISATGTVSALGQVIRSSNAVGIAGFMYDIAESNFREGSSPSLVITNSVSDMGGNRDDVWVVFPGYKIVLYKNTNYGGQTATLDNFSGTRPGIYKFANSGWNLTKSFKVYYGNASSNTEITGNFETKSNVTWV